MIQIFINGVDRANNIEKGSVDLSFGKSSNPSQLSFRMKQNPDRVMPALGESVIVKIDSTSIFRGTVTESSQWVVSGKLYGWKYNVKSSVHDLDRRLVAKAFNNTDSNEVINILVQTFTTGFTTNITGTPVAITSIRFNYEQMSQCLDTICANIGSDWYIDADNVIQVFPKGTVSAPFTITDENDKAFIKSITFDKNIIELKNAVYIRGGYYLDTIAEADSVDKPIADGTQRTIVLAYRYRNIQVKLAGVTQAVGIDYIDAPGDFDVLYNYQQKALKWRNDNKPAASDDIVVWGDAEVPLIVYVQDTDSITAYGLFEGVKIDNTITSVDQANAIGTQLLEQWSAGSYDGSFVTREHGLQVGQQISIALTDMGVTDTFTINNVRATLIGDVLEYTVHFIKSGNVTFNDLMVGLLTQQRKSLQISDDDVVLRFLEIDVDTATLTDAVISIDTTSGPYTYAGGTNDATYGFATWA